MLKNFENFEYDDDIDDYMYKWYNHTMKTLTKILGNPYVGRNADWGAMDMWKLQNDDFEGYFVVIDDDKNFIFLKRTFNVEDENNDDKEIDYLLAGEDITEFVEKVTRVKNRLKFKL